MASLGRNADEFVFEQQPGDAAEVAGSDVTVPPAAAGPGGQPPPHRQRRLPARFPHTPEAIQQLHP